MPVEIVVKGDVVGDECYEVGNRFNFVKSSCRHILYITIE